MGTDIAMLSVMYTAPVRRLRNGALTRYVIRYTRVGSGVPEMMSVDDRTSVISGLDAFTNYSVEVAAVNVNGTGPFSDPVYGVSGQDSE